MKKNIIVTGAGKGIGRAITSKLIGDGYHVLAIDNDQSLLEGLGSTFNDSISAHCLDVSIGADVEGFFTSVDESKLFGLVNNAGIYLGKNILDYSSDELDRVIDINLKGAIYFAKGFGSLMLKNKNEGVIVNLSSSSIFGGSDAIYSSSKSGLIGLTKSCAIKFSPYVRVNAVAPGIIQTDIFKDIPEKTISHYRENELIKKPLVPDDVANTISFLFKEEGKNYSGAVFDLNNGFHL